MNGRFRMSQTFWQRLSAKRPSAPSHTPRMPRSSSVALTTTAPAPSPKSEETVRPRVDEIERRRVRLGADERARACTAPLFTIALAVAEAVEEARALVADVHRRDELRRVAVAQAELLLQVDARCRGSNDPARGSRRGSCRDPSSRSRRSRSRPSTPCTARSDEPTPSSAKRRSSIPVRWRIHSMRRVDAVLRSQIVVRHDARRDVEAGSGDVRVRHDGPSLAPGPAFFRRFRVSVLAVHRDDARAAEAEVVLQRHLRVLHLALVRGAAQLPHQLGALREAGRAERVPLREEAA